MRTDDIGFKRDYGFELFQGHAQAWAETAFGPQECEDVVVRRERFLEEAIELYQSCGGDKDTIYIIANEVFKKPAGDPDQEVGGVMTTLAVLCSASAIKVTIIDAAKRELARIWNMIPTVQRRNLTKQRIIDQARARRRVIDEISRRPKMPVHDEIPIGKFEPCVLGTCEHGIVHGYCTQCEVKEAETLVESKQNPSTDEETARQLAVYTEGTVVAPKPSPDAWSKPTQLCPHEKVRMYCKVCNPHTTVESDRLTVERTGEIDL
jgi:hypothetical protein